MNAIKKDCENLKLQWRNNKKMFRCWLSAVNEHSDLTSNANIG